MSRNRFKSRNAPLQDRGHGTRKANTPAILIVTEGKATEPLYFNSLVDYIHIHYASDLSFHPNIDVQGKGKSTVNLVNDAIQTMAHSHKLYQQCWVVFDKDEYRDFDEAIKLAKEYDINVAWSNPSFEYWLFLHFGYDEVSRDRHEWQRKLDTVFKNTGFSPSGYEKSSDAIRRLPVTDGLLKTAVKNAEKAMAHFPRDAKASAMDPCTNVHSLIDVLNPYISDLMS